MRKSWIITILLCLFIIAASIVAVRWPRTVPLSQCSELYRHYADNPDIHASFIKDFRINDTLVVDVTLLKAASDTGWALLRKDFNIPDIPEEEHSFFYDNDYFSWKIIPKHNPSLPPDSIRLNNDIAAFSYPRRVVGVFTITTEEQMKTIPEMILDYNIDNN